MDDTQSHLVQLTTFTIISHLTTFFFILLV